MNPQFEVKLLLKQNSEMVSKIQVYRRQNQQLNQKNQDLNLWVQNLSEVFAAVGAAWKTITNNEQALFNLMKKRSDQNSKTTISKYISHFKTFDEIINRLGQKITNSGHSMEVTLDAKQRLNAFVQNYELFFKEIVDGYFKFNDEYLQWVTQLKTKPQLSQNFRVIANKEIENKMKIKEFEGFMQEFRGRFKIYECQNQHKLLDGILFTKNQQINSLNQLIQKQTRRLQLTLSYSTVNAQTILQAEQKDFECFCGGMQLQYFKKEWEKHLEELKNMNENTRVHNAADVDTSSAVNKENVQLLEFQKQKLLERISNLQSKIQKMKIQSRLTEDLVLNSSAYVILHSQTEELVSFIDDLLHKINGHYTFLHEIEKAREEELLELKSKLQKAESSSPLTKVNAEMPKVNIQTNLIEFKTSVTEMIADLNKEYVEMNSKITLKQESLTKSKQLIASLQKEVHDLNKKIDQLEAAKNLPLQFRHQKFNEIDKKISELLNTLSQQYQDKQHLLGLWKEFVGYVKSRDKKVKDLETVIKKKEKQLSSKDKLVNVLQQGLKETEAVFLSAQTQVKKFSDFIINTQKELHSLAEKNLALRSQFEQQKLLLNYKMKAESQTKTKMEQKIKSYELIDDQIKEVRRITHQAELNYENWIVEQQKKLMSASLQLEQVNSNYELKASECDQNLKTIKRITQQKQKWKSQCTKLSAIKSANLQKELMFDMRMELDEYKRKIMCNCSREQQRSVVLKTCSHVFCKRCIDDMDNNRNRNCPMCGVKFGKHDRQDIIFS